MQGARSAEVDENRRAVCLQQDIAGLQVAVQQVFGMQVIQRIQYRFENRQQPGFIHCFSGDDFVQLLRLDVGHHVVSSPQRLEGLMHAHDVRVVQVGEDTRLFHKTLQGVGVVLHGIRYGEGLHLQRGFISGGVKGGQVLFNDYLSICALVHCEVGDAETTLPKHMQQLIIPQGNALRQAHRFYLRRICGVVSVTRHDLC